MKELRCRACAGNISRRHFLSCLSLPAAAAFIGLPSLPAFAQSERLKLLLLTEELTNGWLEPLSEWASWLNEATAALQDREIVPAPVFGGDTYAAKMDEALAKARALPVPDPLPPPLIPAISAQLSRDGRRQRLNDAMASLDAASTFGRELRLAGQQLERMSKRIAQQRDVMERAEQVLGEVVPKIAALDFVDKQLAFNWLNLMVYIERNQQIKDTLDDKATKVAALQRSHSTQTRTFGNGLLTLLAGEQSDLASERDSLQREQDGLTKRQQALEEKGAALGLKATEELEARNLAQRTRELMVDAQQDRQAWQRRRQQLDREANSLQQSINTPFKCSAGYGWNECTDHQSEKDQYVVNRNNMQAEHRRTLTAIRDVDAAIDQLVNDLVDLERQRDAQLAKATRLADELSAERGRLATDRNRLEQDVKDFFAKRWRSRADTLYAESQQQTQMVEQWLRSI